MTERPSQQLARMVRERTEPRRIDMTPATAYEAITRRMVEDLASEVRDLRSRIDRLIFVVLGAIIVDILLRLAGV